MTYYKCNSCGMEFDTYEAGNYVPYDTIDVDFENYPTCPYCDSLDLEEVEDEDDNDSYD